MARSGLSNIILRLRSMTDTDVGESYVNSAPFWQDDDLQAVLDECRTDVYAVELSPVYKMEGGNEVLKDFIIPQGITPWIEEDFTLIDSDGNTVSGWSFTLGNRRIVFTTDQTGETPYYLRGSYYDLNAAAAEVWLRKAGMRAERVDFKAGPHSIAEDQVYNHCMTMYKRYSGKRGIGLNRLQRIDYDVTQL